MSFVLQSFVSLFRFSLFLPYSSNVLLTPPLYTSFSKPSSSPQTSSNTRYSLVVLNCSLNHTHYFSPWSSCILLTSLPYFFHLVPWRVAMASSTLAVSGFCCSTAEHMSAPSLACWSFSWWRYFASLYVTSVALLGGDMLPLCSRVRYESDQWVFRLDWF